MALPQTTQRMPRTNVRDPKNNSIDHPALVKEVDRRIVVVATNDISEDEGTFSVFSCVREPRDRVLFVLCLFPSEEMSS